MSTIHSDEAFDRAMRARYREALQHVSSATRTRLHADRHAALRGEPMAVRGWPLGAAFGGVAAVVFAVTLGLNFNRGAPVDGGAPSASQAGSAMLVTPGVGMPIVTGLDQDPDFYVWLASSDAQLMAME